MPESVFASRRRNIFSSFVLLILVIGITACGGGGGSTKTPPASLLSIAVSPSSPSVALGIMQQFAAKGAYSDGTTKDITNSCFWTSASTGVATISAAGLANTLAQGSSVITASSGPISAISTLTVIAPALVSIAVSPNTVSIPKGTQQQFVATGTFTDTSKQTLSNVAWASSSAKVASISSSGIATALTVGTSTITASSGSISATASLTITPPALVSIALAPQDHTVISGFNQQFTATGTYSDSTSQPLTALAWTVSDPSLATIDSTGLVTTLHPGTEFITATSGSLQGVSQLNIAQPILTAITVSPGLSTLQLGSNAADQLAATGTYSDKSTADITDLVSWTVSNTYVASVSTSGSALPIRNGFTKVTAAQGKIVGTAGLTVLSNPRYLYEATDSGRDVSRLTVNAATGQLRHWGYQTTQETNNLGQACITTDPSNQFVYVTNVIAASSGSGYATAVSAYSVDPSSGTLTSLGLPYTLSESIGCLQFEPGGSFAYATPGVDEATQQIVTIAKDSAGALSIVKTTLLPDYAGGLAIDPLGRFLYVGTQQLVANATASTYGYSIDASNGDLTPIIGTPFSLPINTGAAFSFNPSGDFLYLSDSNGTSVTGYSVDQTTGILTAGTAAATPCINPSALSFTPDGRFAFVACGESINRDPAAENLISFAVGSGGGLTQIGAYSAYLTPTSMTIDPSDKYLYLISSGANYVKNGAGSYSGGFNSVVTYSINLDGTLTELNETAGRVGEDSMILLGGASPLTFSTPWLFITDSFPFDGFDPASYQLNSYMVVSGGLFLREGTGAVNFPFSLTSLPWGAELLLAGIQPAPNLEAFTFDSQATLLNTGSTFGVGSTPAGLIMDPSGNVAFGSDSSTGLVYWYGYQNAPGQWGDIGSSGTPASFSAEAGAGPLAMDPAGRYLFVANKKANSISEFQYAGAAAKNPYSLSTSPLAIATDPTGNLVFVAGSDNQLHMLALNVNGDFSDKADVPLVGTPTSITVEPTGRYVYVSSSGGLDSFAIDQTKETLTPVTQKLPIPLSPAVGAYADPSGRYLYVVAPDTTYNLGGNGIYGFTINSDGTLNAIANTTLAVLNTASSVAFQTIVQ